MLAVRPLVSFKLYASYPLERHEKDALNMKRNNIPACEWKIRLIRSAGIVSGKDGKNLDVLQTVADVVRYFIRHEVTAFCSS